MDVKFIFRKISLILLITLSNLLACSTGRIWKIPVEELRENCRQSKYTFLKTIDFTREDPAEIRKLQPGAPYYFFLIFNLIGENAAAIRVLEAAYPTAALPWRQLYAQTLADFYLEQQDYPAAAALAGAYLTRFPTDPESAAIRQIEVEALYWQELNEETLQLLQDYFPAPRQGELLLFETVCRYRLNDPAWEDPFFKLCLEETSSLLHARLYRFLEIRQQLQTLPSTLGQLLEAKYQLANGKPNAAIEPLKAFFTEEAESTYNRTSLIRELGHAWLNTGDYARGGSFLTKLAGTLSGEQRLSALELAGRLYHKQKYEANARPLLEQVYNESLDAVQQDRALWYYLDTYLDLSPGEFLNQLYPLATRWHDPAYFADHLHTTISNLVASGDWVYLQQMAARLQEQLSPAVQRRLTYILNRVVDLGYLEADPAGLPQVDDSPGYRRGLDYYGFMDAFRAGRLPAFFATEQSDKTAPEALDPQKEQLARGYFEFGLTDLGNEYVAANYTEVSKESILAAVRSLVLGKQYRLAISLMKRVVNIARFPLTPRDLDYLFPVPFAPLIETLATQEGVASAVLYALVYVESAFDPTIGSAMGAKGLTQLMDETALDMARLLRITNPDPWDPNTNLSLGTHFLARLYTRLEDLPKAFMAYNAGLTRVRRWEESFGNLPVDLMVEALPFTETREYLCAVIEAAVMYGFIYTGIPPADSLRMFYPNF